MEHEERSVKRRETRDELLVLEEARGRRRKREGRLELTDLKVFLSQSQGPALVKVLGVLFDDHTFRY